MKWGERTLLTGGFDKLSQRVNHQRTSVPCPQDTLRVSLSKGIRLPEWQRHARSGSEIGAGQLNLAMNRAGMYKGRLASRPHPEPSTSVSYFSQDRFQPGNSANTRRQPVAHNDSDDRGYPKLDQTCEGKVT